MAVALLHQIILHRTAPGSDSLAIEREFFSITILRVSCSISVYCFNQAKEFIWCSDAKLLLDGEALSFGASASHS
jgi:hypothetical protein